MKTSWIVLIIISVLVLAGLVFFFWWDWKRINTDWYLAVLDTEPKMLAGHLDHMRLLDVWIVEVIPASKKTAATTTVYRLNKDLGTAGEVNITDSHILYTQPLDKDSIILKKIEQAQK